MHEPTLLLRLAMFHFPGGEGYLCGLLLFCLAQMGLGCNCSERWRRTLTIASRIGLVWSFLLPSPTPRWLLIVFAASLLWFCGEDWRQRFVSDPAVRVSRLQRGRRLSWLVAGCALVIVLFELPYKFSPTVGSVSSYRLSIVADSVTAGLNDGEDTWPQRLARSSLWTITDESQAAVRIAKSRPLTELDQYEIAIWSFDLPRLGQPDTVRTLTRFVEKNSLECLLIAPLYLALQAGDVASNIYSMGAKLIDLTTVVRETGVTLVLAHHTRKVSRQDFNRFAPPELNDFAFAGIAEWARQWILLGRRSEYDPEQAGHHDLWLVSGGSTGHSADGHSPSTRARGRITAADAGN